MRVIVTGSRDWPWHEAVYAALRRLRLDTTEGDTLTVVHGACPTGADRAAADWCELVPPPCGVPRRAPVRAEPFPADWETYGRGAGPIRNQAMVDAGADRVLAFQLGTGSRGTRDCVGRARVAGIPITRHLLVVDDGGNSVITI